MESTHAVVGMDTGAGDTGAGAVMGTFMGDWIGVATGTDGAFTGAATVDGAVAVIGLILTGEAIGAALIPQ